MSKSQTLRAEHVSGALLSIGNLRTVVRGNTQGSPFSTWSKNGHRILLGGREPESAFLKLPPASVLYRIQDFPWDHGLCCGDSNPIDEGYRTAAFRVPRRILSTSERVQLAGGRGPPTGGQPVINFSLYARWKEKQKAKPKPFQ